MTAPAKVREVGYWLRTRIDGRTDLLPSDKQVARVIGYARCGRYTHAITRVRIAIRTGLSIRTVTRAVARLVAAGVLMIEEIGRIERGRRYQQVYRILSPQVSPSATLSPLSGPSSRKTTHRATHRRQLTPKTAIPGRTTARQPATPAAADRLTTAETAGDGTRTTTRTQ